MDHYIAECRLLYNDLQLLIHDFGRNFRRTLTIYWAVDFTEMYAVDHPGENLESLRLFDGEESETISLREHFVLSKVFSNSASEGSVDLFSTRPILLPPYGREVISYVASSASMNSERIRLARREIEGLEEDPWIRALLALQSESRRDMERDEETELELDEEIDFVHIIEARLPHLSYLMSQVNSSVTRLMDILHSGLMGSVESLGCDLSLVDQHLVNMWNDELLSIRGRRYSNSCYLDALAMGIISSLNVQIKSLLGPDNRIYLLTRSSMMHDIALSSHSREVRQSGQYLRHPRYLAALHSMESLPDSEKLSNLEELRSSLGLFLDTCDEQGPNGLDPEWFESRVSEIRNSLTVAASLSSWLSLSQAWVGSATQTAPRLTNRLDDLVRQSGNTTLLRSRLVSYLSTLQDRMERQYLYLGVALVVQQSRGLKEGLDNIGLEYVNGKVIVSNPGGENLFTLQVQQATIEVFGVEVERAQSMNPDSAVSMLFTALIEREDHEMILLGASLLGAWNEWTLADMYCEKAIGRWEEKARGVHEAYYFAGMCKRHLSPKSVRNYSDAERYLRRAIAAKDRERGDGYRGDPRYWKELSAILLEWHELANDDPFGFGSTKPRVSVSSALSMSLKALELIRDDIQLKVKVLNNLCYCYLLESDVRDLELAFRYGQNMVDTARRSLGGDIPSWPHQYVDTLALLIWMGGRDSVGVSADEEVSIVARLKELSRDEVFDRETRSLLSRHLERFDVGC